MRDMNRLVLAEDNRELAHGLREVLETVGGYEVWITWLVYDVIQLLKRTEGAWLVLDLQLEDGYSGHLVPEIRRLWGDRVYIIVLSGLFDRYPEHELLGFGADNFLRKPYSPNLSFPRSCAPRRACQGSRCTAVTTSCYELAMRS